MKRHIIRMIAAGAIAVMAIGIAPRPASATQANRSFVYAVWMDFTGSPPSADELLWFETLLGNGSMSRAGVIDYVTGTSDFQDTYSYSVFETYIKRFPTSAEKPSIASALSGGNYLEVELLALSSADYSEAQGGSLSNADFVTKLYNDVLWRAPDPSGLTYYTNLLAGGQTRRQAANTMIRSNEAAGKRVSGQVQSPCSTTQLATYSDIRAGAYCLILDRPSDSAGATYWTSALSSGGSQLPALWQSLAASNEYLTKAQARFPSV